MDGSSWLRRGSFFGTEGKVAKNAQYLPKAVLHPSWSEPLFVCSLCAGPISQASTLRIRTGSKIQNHTFTLISTPKILQMYDSQNFARSDRSGSAAVKMFWEKSSLHWASEAIIPIQLRMALPTRQTRKTQCARNCSFRYDY